MHPSIVSRFRWQFGPHRFRDGNGDHNTGRPGFGIIITAYNRGHGATKGSGLLSAIGSNRAGCTTVFMASAIQAEMYVYARIRIRMYIRVYIWSVDTVHSS